MSLNVIFILSLLLNYILTQSNTDKNNNSSDVNPNSCETSFECKQSMCCINNICEPNETCQNRNKNVYLIIGLLGLFFVLVSLLYMFIVINYAKKNVKVIKEKVFNEESKKE